MSKLASGALFGAPEETTRPQMGRQAGSVPEAQAASTSVVVAAAEEANPLRLMSAPATSQDSRPPVVSTRVDGPTRSSPAVSLEGASFDSAISRSIALGREEWREGREASDPDAEAALGLCLQEVRAAHDLKVAELMAKRAAA